MKSLYKNFNIHKKIAVIVGGSGFLGKETCKILLQAGAIVINLDIKKLDIKHNNYYYYKLDISNETAVNKVYKYLSKKFKKIDILINHSHYKGNIKKLDKDSKFFNSFDSYPFIEWKKTIDINLNGLFLTTKFFLKLLLKSKKPVIVNTSSTYGKVSPNKNIYGDSGINSPISYSTTKYGIIGFTKYIATHYASKGLRANVLIPGAIENKNQSKIFKKNYKTLTPMNKLSKENSYADAMLFLVSDASSYMTGSELIIDGGWTAW